MKAKNVVGFLGQRPTCVRKCARVMLLSCVACAALSIMKVPFACFASCIAFSILVTSLLLAHLIAYAIRSSQSITALPSVEGRRLVIRQVVRTFTTLAVLTTIPAITQTGWAQGVAKTVNCKNGTGSCGPCGAGQNCNCWCDIVGDPKCNPCG
jgi:hypothetical protein